MHAPYRHIFRIQIVQSVHVAVDMKQVTLHCTQTHTHMYSGTHACTHKHSPAYALQVCRCKILISYVPSVVTASSPISALTCSSPSITHTHTHTLPALSAAAAAVAMGTSSIVQGDPCFPRIEKTPASEHLDGRACVCALLYLHMLRSHNL